jgi:hypothetical protein
MSQTGSVDIGSGPHDQVREAHVSVVFPARFGCDPRIALAFSLLDAKAGANTRIELGYENVTSQFFTLTVRSLGASWSARVTWIASCDNQMPAGIEELAGCPNEPITEASGPRLLTIYFPEKLDDIPKVRHERDTDTAPIVRNSGWFMLRSFVSNK